MGVRLNRQWLSWLLGAAVLAAVVAAAAHFSEERAFVRLLGQIEPAWLLAVLLLQAATYFAQATTWLVVLRRGGAPVPFVERLQMPEYWRETGWPDACRPAADGAFTCRN